VTFAAAVLMNGEVPHSLQLYFFDNPNPIVISPDTWPWILPIASVTAVVSLGLLLDGRGARLGLVLALFWAAVGLVTTRFDLVLATAIPGALLLTGQRDLVQRRVRPRKASVIDPSDIRAR
jgi:hypothetical protein